MLHNFAGFSDGANLEGGLISDGAGNFFGTTLNGGARFRNGFRVNAVIIGLESESLSSDQNR